MNKFIIKGTSLTGPTKTKCGDSHIYQELKDENIILLCVADGVGSRHHDYAASRMACEIFVNVFTESKGMELKQRFEFALKQTDQDISEPEDSSLKGMMTTFVAVVWSQNEDKVLFSSIGDSRLYKHSFGKLEQLSTDSKKAVIMRDRSGKPIKSGGILVIREGITNAFGYNGAEINIEESSFNYGESLTLTSDGMHETPEYAANISSMLNKGMDDLLFNQFIEVAEKNINDDSTLLILQRIDDLDINFTKYEETIVNKIENQEFHQHLFVRYVKQNLINSLSKGKTDIAQSIIDYDTDYTLCFDEEFINDCIQILKTKELKIQGFYTYLINHLRKIKSM